MKTLLMNSTRKEFLHIGTGYPEKLPYYLEKLERDYSWDLRLDHIFISYSHTTNNYMLVG